MRLPGKSNLAGDQHGMDVDGAYHGDSGDTLDITAARQKFGLYSAGKTGTGQDSCCFHVSSVQSGVYRLHLVEYKK